MVSLLTRLQKPRLLRAIPSATRTTLRLLSLPLGTTSLRSWKIMAKPKQLKAVPAIAGVTPRSRHLFKKYGITEEQYDELLQKQNGSCAVCRRSAKEFKVRLCVDHDHWTGQVRGLLCTYCNRRIVGRHRRDLGADLLRAAYEYLTQEYPGWVVPLRVKKKRRKKKKWHTYLQVQELYLCYLQLESLRLRELLSIPWDIYPWGHTRIKRQDGWGMFRVPRRRRLCGLAKY